VQTPPKRDNPFTHRRCLCLFNCAASKDQTPHMDEYRCAPTLAPTHVHIFAHISWSLHSQRTPTQQIHMHAGGASKARDLDGGAGQADCFEFGGQHSRSARIETAGRGRSNEEQQNA